MYEIDQSIILQAANCDMDFICLTEKAHPSCKVESCIGCSVHFIEKLERNCNFNQAFGNGHVCICPVRKEIYNKYGT